jgi:hypothetical protein
MKLLLLQKFIELEDYSSNEEAIENNGSNGVAKEPSKSAAEGDEGPIVEMKNFSAKWGSTTAVRFTLPHFSGLFHKRIATCEKMSA